MIIQLDDQDELYLEISVNHSDPYINVRYKFSRAKKNTIGFFSELVNNKIKEVLIASDDRIIKIVTDFGDLFFAIRGKHTNIFFNSNILSSFKNETKDNLTLFKQEFERKFFLNSFNIPDPDVIHGKSIAEIRQKYRFIGREIENEVNIRKSENDIESDILLTVLQDIFTENAAVYTNENTGEINAVSYTHLTLPTNREV